MLYTKKGFPEEGELVLCTVTKILHNSIFCDLDEYGKSGLIHISEIAPGRIRNLRDYVKEGKKIICKILEIKEDKGHINLSLRRVGEGLRRKKTEEIKQELKAEKIIEFVAQELKKEVKEVYKEISEKILGEDYEYIYVFFEDVVAEETSVKDLKLDEKIAKVLEETIIQRIKPPSVTISGVLTVTSYHPEGVNLIRDALEEGEKAGTEIRYLGAGKYTMKITASDYKEAEGILATSLESVEKKIGNDGDVSLER